jgi:hypothetical protein
MGIVGVVDAVSSLGTAPVALPSGSKWLTHPEVTEILSAMPGQRALAVVFTGAAAGNTAHADNGGKNESGIKRVRAFLAKARALGFQIEWYEPGQSYGVKATRYGGGSYTVQDSYLTEAQAATLLEI